MFNPLDLGFKPIKYFIDSLFRPTVTPVAGSVLYSDLYFAVEHSGIYVGDNQISNIVVDSLLTCDSTVRLSDPADFTEKSKMGKKSMSLVAVSKRWAMTMSAMWRMHEWAKKVFMDW